MPSVDIAPTELATETSWGKVSRNPYTVSAILSLIRAGKTQTEVAKTFGITQSAVSRVIDKYTPRDDLAKLRAQALSPAMIESLKRSAINGEKAGRHGAAEAILKAARVIGSDGEGGGPRVVVIMGGSAQPNAMQLGEAKPTFRPDSSPLSLGESLPVTD